MSTKSGFWALFKIKIRRKIRRKILKNKNNSIIMLRIAFLKIMCYTTLAFIKVLFVPLVQWIEQGPPKS